MKRGKGELWKRGKGGKWERKVYQKKVYAEKSLTFLNFNFRLFLKLYFFLKKSDIVILLILNHMTRIYYNKFV